MRVLLYSILISMTLSCSSTQNGYPIEIVGWIENVKILPENITFSAKLDTGAKSSSIHAENVTEFEKNNENWVRFDIENKQGKGVTIEKKISRIVKIKRKGAESQKRIVVKFKLCLGNTVKETDFTLVNRKNFNYKVLVGRRFLEHDFAIDSSKKNTLRLVCKE